MRKNERNRGNYGSNKTSVERNHQNRYYYANEDSDIYENEFQNEEEIYDDDEDRYGRDSAFDNPERQNDYQNEYEDENELNWQYRNAIDREEYEHQRSMGYISNNPKRLRKPSKRRYVTDAEREKRRRNRYIMESLRMAAERV